MYEKYLKGIFQIISGMHNPGLRKIEGLACIIVCFKGRRAFPINHIFLSLNFQLPTTK